MTLDGSMDGKAFTVFVEKCLVPQLWSGAVVVMDNLPAHKLAVIAPLVRAVGADVLNLSPYSQTLIRLNCGGHNSNLFTSVLANHHKNGGYAHRNCT
jgi:transposase